MTTITPDKLQTIIEAALFVSGQPLNFSELQRLFQDEAEQPAPADIKAALEAIKARFSESGIELKEVASGYRLQAKAELSSWLSRLWEERAPRYSRAFLETLAIIAYKQPITRAEIEDIRGVTVSSHIIKTMLDREWIRVIGYRDIPGKPAILGTTKDFLNYFNLKSLTELPTLAEFKNFEAQEAQLQVQLALEDSNIHIIDSENIPEESINYELATGRA
jgi:segregation and condensation protein B